MRRAVQDERRRAPPELSDSGSIPYADADSDMNNCWDSSASSCSDAAPPLAPLSGSLISGVDCCSLNNLLDAIAEVDGGGVGAAYSFSTLLDSDPDGECPSSSSGGGFAPVMLTAPPARRGHTLPSKQRVRWVDAGVEDVDDVQLTPDELYYYCPRKHPADVPGHNNNGSLLKTRGGAGAVRSESFNSKSVGVGAVVRMQRRQHFAAHVEPRNSPRDKVGWGVGGSVGGWHAAVCVPR